MQRFRGGLVCQSHRLLYHSTLGSRVIKKKRRETRKLRIVVCTSQGRALSWLESQDTVASCVFCICALETHRCHQSEARDSVLQWFIGLKRCWSVTEAGSYLRLIDSCITQLTAQGPSRTCNESNEEEELCPGARKAQMTSKRCARLSLSLFITHQPRVE